MASLAWGVACFVILYSYGEGFGVALQTSFQAVGQDLVLMFGGQTSTQAGGERSGRKIRLDARRRATDPRQRAAGGRGFGRGHGARRDRGARLSPAEHVGARASNRPTARSAT